MLVPHALPPSARGLCDPRHEHDACGVGFVVDVKGRRSHAVVEQGPADPARTCCTAAPAAARRTQATARASSSRCPTGSCARRRHGLGIHACRRRRHATPASSSCRRAAAEREQRATPIERTVVRRRATQVLGWRDVPSDDATPRRAAGADASRSSNRSSSPTPERVADDDARRGSARARALRHPQADRARGRSRWPSSERARVLHRRPVGEHADLQGHADGRSDRADASRPDRIPTSNRRSRSCTSASARTRSRRGRSPTRTATSRTTARSTRCAATSTGCARARDCCRSTLLGDDLKKILPIIREGGSDTATFDNVLEFLVMSGRSLPHAILMMIPEPWSSHETHDARAEGVLRIPLVADGAVGRPGVDRVHRRHA